MRSPRDEEAPFLPRTAESLEPARQAHWFRIWHPCVFIIITFILVHTPLVQYCPLAGPVLVRLAIAPTTTFSTTLILPFFGITTRGLWRQPGLFWYGGRQGWEAAKLHAPLPAFEAVQQARLASAQDTAADPYVVLGIMTTADRTQRRALLREVQLPYCGTQQGGREIVCRFIIGAQRDAESLRMLEQEQLLHGDIVVLDEPENMNNGKTIDFFRWAAGAFPGASFVAKQDDDTFAVPANLASVLAEHDPEGLVYFGGCGDGGCTSAQYYIPFYVGMLYGVSRPLAHWIASLPPSSPEFAMPEDMLVGRMVHTLPDSKRRKVVRLSLDGVLGDWRGHHWYPWDRETAIGIHHLKSDEEYRNCVRSVMGA